MIIENMPKFIEQYKGKEYEYDAYGECIITPEFKYFMKRIYDTWNELNLDEKEIYQKNLLIKFIVKNYTEDPHRPKAPLARELHKLLIQEIKLNNPQRLSFFSSLETPLDRKHIDGFFMIDDDPDLVVTTDITLRKKEEGKPYIPAPDHVILYGDLLQGERETDIDYKKRLLPEVKLITNTFRRKVQALQEKFSMKGGRQ